MHGAFMQTRDEKDGYRPDHQPSPARHVKAFLDAFHLLVEQQHGKAERETENGHPAQRNRYAHDTRASQRLEYEEAKYAIDQIKQADDVLSRGEVSPPRFEDRRRRGEIGDEECGKPNKAAPDHPPHTLIVL